MDRYQRVEKPRSDTPISENEIRITTLGKMRNYITYATSLLQDKATPEIVLKAMGRAINKSVTIAEIIKRRVAGLHQVTTIGSTDIVDVWEPLEEGLQALEQVRHVSMISITLSLKELDTTSTGYQPPLAPELVKPLAPEYEDDREGSPGGDRVIRGRGRGRGRGQGRGRGRARGMGFGSDYNGGELGWAPGRGRGRGRGRSFGYRGRGRGYANTSENTLDAGYDDSNSVPTDGFPRGRGRGRARGRGRGRGRGFQQVGA